MAACILTLLGGLALRSTDGRDLAPSTRKDRLLLSYLALNAGRPLARDRLAGLLWGDRGETQARDSLRHTLAAIRQAFHVVDLDPITSERDSVSFNPEGIEVDAVSFERLAAQPESQPQAAPLYRGPLLDGIDGMTPEFEAWLGPERERLSSLAVRLIQQIAEAAEPSEPAISLARLLLARDPLCEPVYRALMRLHVSRGDRAAALKLYTTCRDTLKAELGATPDQKTETLYRDLLIDRPSSASELANPVPDRPSIAVPFSNLSGGVKLDGGLRHPSPASKMHPILPWGAAGLAVTAAVAALWFGALRFENTPVTGPSGNPERLSIVALPFKTPQDSPDYNYFAEGIVSELTTDLSRIQGSFVISANTAAKYKGRTIDAKQAASELNVRYVLEGSLRRVGNRVRINAQLVDATTGIVEWADLIEGDWTNSVKLQDEITGQLARTLDLKLIEAESRRAQADRPNKPDAVDLVMRGWSTLNQPLARKNVSDAQQFFEQALEIDPNLPKALIGLGRTLAAAVNARWSVTPDQDLARADDAITRVLLGYPNDAMAHFVKAEIFRGRKDFESAIAEYKVAISIDRNLAPAHANLAATYIRAGRTQEAFEPVALAIRLSPRDPLLHYWYYLTCHAHIHLRHDALAIEWCRRSVGLTPYWSAYIDLIAAYGWTGQKPEAQAALAELEKLKPSYTVDRWRNEGWSDNPTFLAEYQHIIQGLQKGGMRER